MFRRNSLEQQMDFDSATEVKKAAAEHFRRQFTARKMI